MKLPKIFYSKAFLIIAVIVFLLTAGLEYNQYRARRSIDSEITALKLEEQRLYEANQDLKSSIDFLSSPEYQDKLARLQFNLKKEGEIVVNFPPDNLAEAQGNQTTAHKSNVLEWWKYIFIN